MWCLLARISEIFIKVRIFLQLLIYDRSASPSHMNILLKKGLQQQKLSELAFKRTAFPCVITHWIFPLSLVITKFTWNEYANNGYIAWPRLILARDTLATVKTGKYHIVITAASILVSLGKTRQRPIFERPKCTINEKRRLDFHNLSKADRTFGVLDRARLRTLRHTLLPLTSWLPYLDGHKSWFRFLNWYNFCSLCRVKTPGDCKLILQRFKSYFDIATNKSVTLLDKLVNSIRYKLLPCKFLRVVVFFRVRTVEPHSTDTRL